MGGGGAQEIILRGVTEVNYPEYNTAIFGTHDDGGKSFFARLKYGVVPPGDYFLCLYGMMEDQNQAKRAFALLNNRDETPMLRDMLAHAAEHKYHGIDEGIDAIRELFRVRGHLVPVSTQDLKLYAETINGSLIYGESNIDNRGKAADFEPENITSDIFYDVDAQANPRAIQAIKEADEIIVTPGSPYTSIFPLFIVHGIREAIMESTARLTVIPDLSTTRGEDHHLDTVGKWLHGFEHFLGERQDILAGKKNSRIDRVIINNDQIDEEVVEIYKHKGQSLVKFDEERCAKIALGAQFIRTGLIDEEEIRRRLIRHDSRKTAIAAILN